MRNYSKPVFTEKHYNVLADIILHSTATNKYELAQDLAKFFQEDNQKFKSLKWFRAVGITMAQCGQFGKYPQK